MILLVRHARPAASAAVPASRWPLTAEGLADAAALAERLAPLAGPGAVLVASDEPKAWQTLGPLAAALGRSPSEVVRDNRFGEVRRPEESWDDAWRERRRGWVEGADRPGWEGRADVAARFDGALAEHLAPAGAGTGGAGAAAGDGHLVVGSHGMVLTCWLASRGLVGPDDAGAFWSDLRLPDAFAVDLAAGTVTRLGDPRTGRSTCSARPDDAR